MEAKERIQRYFAFDQSDLDANCLGQYTAQQKKKVRDLEVAVSWFWFAAGLVFVGLGGWRVSVLLRAPETRQAWVLPIVVIVLGLWFLGSAFRDIDTSIRRVEGEVAFLGDTAATIPLKELETGRFSMVRVGMKIGEEVFDAVDPRLSRVMEGRRYAVYYVAGTREVLSVEEV